MFGMGWSLKMEAGVQEKTVDGWGEVGGKGKVEVKRQE